MRSPVCGDLESLMGLQKGFIERWSWFKEEPTALETLKIIERVLECSVVEHEVPPQLGKTHLPGFTIQYVRDGASVRRSFAQKDALRMTYLGSYVPPKVGKTRKTQNFRNLLIYLVAMSGLEPPTSALWMPRSNQLSYIATSGVDCCCFTDVCQ